MTVHNGQKKAISKFFIKNAGTRLLFKKPEQQGDNNGDDYHGGDWDIDLKIGPVNYDITGQPADGQPTEPWPEKPCPQENHPYSD
jgi:hypothetical protein